MTEDMGQDNDYEAGYHDGWDAMAPQPNLNRSQEYRKGFWQGRADRDETGPKLKQEDASHNDQGDLPGHYAPHVDVERLLGHAPLGKRTRTGL